MIEQLQVLAFSILIFIIGFIAGNQYTTQKQIDKDQSQISNIIMQQLLPKLGGLHGG
jgi:hypothetical protein